MYTYWAVALIGLRTLGDRLWQGVRAWQHRSTILLGRFRLNTLEPIPFFGAIWRWLCQSPGVSLVSFLIVAILALNVLASERDLIKGPSTQTFGGPEAQAGNIPGSDSVAPALDSHQALSPDSGIPDTFSGYFFVFEDSIAGWSNPVSDSLPAIPSRSELMTYGVSMGDTPQSIATKFGISVETLLWANNLHEGANLQTGQRLVILPVSGVLHEVYQGETLPQLANLYGISASRIALVNNISDGQTITPGETLVIPGVQPPGFQAQQTPVAGSHLSDQEVVGFLKAPTTGWNWGKLHHYNAVDIANACGTPIYAAAAGFVTAANPIGWNEGYGNYIDITHGNGAMTRYAHLSALAVSEGAYVNQGDLIGAMGDTGDATGCHLHFEVHGATNPFART